MAKYRLLLMLLALSVLLIGSVSLYVFGWFPQQSIKLTTAQLYKVDKGMGFNQLCRRLAQQDVIERCGPLKWYSKFSPQLRQIKAGSYWLEPDFSHLQLLQLLHSGKEHQFSFTLVEGEKLSEVLAHLKTAPYLHQDLPPAAQLSAQLASQYDHLEGLLYPDTYHYSANSSALAIVKRAYEKMERILHQEWHKRAANLPYESAYEALIMASIIEKETARAEERPLIASVFVNRLNKRMRLQTDPTVIYGLGDGFDGNITRAHLKQKTPYNTYRINGLPPTPIAMPALAAIQAALDPVASDYLYFVAKNDGSHYFSTTLKQHNRAVAQYQLGRGN